MLDGDALGARNVRKGKMAKRRRRKRRRPSLVLLVLLGLLIAGFLARRVMMPRAMHYLSYRPSESPRPIADVNQPAPETNLDERAAQSAPTVNSIGQAPPVSTAGATAEHVTSDDRAALEAILKRKSK